MTDLSAFVWRHLVLPSPVSPAQAEALLLSFAALPGQPRLVLEALGTAGAVSWRIGTARSVQLSVARLVATHVPAARMTDESSNEQLSVDLDALHQVAALRLPGSRRLPLATAMQPTATRGLLGVFASTRRTELVRLQLILGPRLRPHHLPEARGGRPVAARSQLVAKHAG